MAELGLIILAHKRHASNRKRHSETKVVIQSALFQEASPSYIRIIVASFLMSTS